jgi:D-alanine-D-alanine ligase
MLIGLLYDPPPPAPGEDILSVEGSLLQVQMVGDALARLGHRTEHLRYDGSVPALVERIESVRPDLVFNLVQSRDCAGVAGLLDLLGMAYSGADALAIELTTDKVLTKDVLKAHGVAVPAYQVVDDDVAVDDLVFPAIVKLRFGDNSVGLDDGSIVHDLAQARARVAHLRASFDDALLVEEFVDGRELSVAILGNPPDLDVLPLREADFSALPDGKPRIMSYAAKWVEDSVEYNSVEVLCPAPVDEPLRSRLVAAAVAAYRLTGCRDYARVDFRVGADGVPRVMEVNTNPDLQESGGFTISAWERFGEYDPIVAAVLDVVCRRVGLRQPTPAAV